MRSTFQRFLYLLSFLPSCALLFVRFRRYGTIISIFKCLRRFRSGSLSYPLSPISLLGRFFGRPRPERGTLTASRVCSASFTSAGAAEARTLPKGIPWPSTTTIHFVPLPFLVFPTQAPPFLPVRSCRR